MASSFHHHAAPALDCSALLVEGRGGPALWAEAGPLAGGCSGRAD
jgi:hypothetical protein